jgi:hypothetical protein
MRYMPQPLSFRWDPEFIARIDAARGDVSRSLFVRRAVERALGEGRRDGDSRTDVSQLETGPVATKQAEKHPARRSPAPAEQTRRVPVPGPNVSRIRSSAQAKAESSGPIPRGKR